MRGGVQLQRELEIEGLHVTLLWKRVRYLRLKVARTGRLSCSLPLSSSQAEAEYFIRCQLPWLRRRLAALRLEEQTPNPDLGLEADRVWFFGRLYPVREEAGCLQPSYTGRAFILPQGCSPAAREAALQGLLQQLFKAAVEQSLARWQAALGLYPKEWRLFQVQSRWGECLPSRGLIKFNLRLVYRPRACLDYVVVHELAHLRYGSHDAAFWQLVASVLPDYRERRQLLQGFLFLARGLEAG